MIKGYTKQTIIICFLLQGIALSRERKNNKCGNDTTINVEEKQVLLTLSPPNWKKLALVADNK